MELEHFRYCLSRSRWHIVDFADDARVALCGFRPKDAEWTYHYSFASDPEPSVTVCVRCLGKLPERIAVLGAAS